MIEEKQGSVVTAQYVWTPFYVDQMVERDDHNPSTAGTSLNRRLYPTTDADNSTTSLTNSSGMMVEQYKYDPYGGVTITNASGSAITVSAFNWIYLHQGLRLDPTTGLYYDRNRIYDPSLGRFLQQDPTKSNYVDGADLYVYQRLNPTASLDPDGTSDIIGGHDEAVAHYNYGGGSDALMSNEMRDELWGKWGENHSDTETEGARERTEDQALAQLDLGELSSCQMQVGSATEIGDWTYFTSNGHAYSSYNLVFGHRAQYRWVIKTTVSVWRDCQGKDHFRTTVFKQLEFTKKYTFEGTWEKYFDGLFAGAGKSYDIYGKAPAQISITVDVVDPKTWKSE